MKITRDVIADLWSLCASGEASEDSRRLVDEFLAGDPEYARTLGESTQPIDLAAPVVELPPSHEAEALHRTKRRLRRRSPFWILAVVFTAFTFGRIIQDTTFTASPVRVVSTGIVAIVFWILYGWHTSRLREGALGR